MSDDRMPCEYVPPYYNTRWSVKGKHLCTAFAEPHSRYCPAHRGGVERTAVSRPRVKRDLSLDVLPWTPEDAAALNRDDRKRSVKQEQ